MSGRDLREHLVKLLKGRGAHVSLDRVVDSFPRELAGERPHRELPTAWSLVEHLRIAQWDILEFSRDPEHVSPSFPDGYWPSDEAPPADDSWEQSVAAFHRDLQAMADLVADPASDLYTPFAHGKGQTLLREALLVADHNSYHLGQLVQVRRLLGVWPEDG